MAGTNHVVIIADAVDPASTSLRIQDFEKDGRSFIPIFSSEQAFKKLTKDSPFIDKGMSIDFDMLLGMLNGDETMILNPGSKRPWVLTAQS